MAQSISLLMGQKQAQSLKQTQRLIMSPQMQQALSLLQMPVLELSQAIETEMAQNPLLEYSEEKGEKIEEHAQEECAPDCKPDQEVSFDEHNFDVLRQVNDEYRDHFELSQGPVQTRSQEEEELQSFLENSITRPQSLYEHLMEQVRENLDECDHELAEAIIGDLTDSGFFVTPLEEVAALSNRTVADAARVLAVIRTFDPYGIAAASLQDCLLQQLRLQNKKNSLAYKVIERHYENLLHNRIPLIIKDLNCDPAELKRVTQQEIARLDLHPGAPRESASLYHITPDVKIEEGPSGLQVRVNEESLPALRINPDYLALLKDPKIPRETVEYIASKVQSSKWLMRSIGQRNDTLFRIASYIVRTQGSFFTNRDGKLNPMTMKEVAQELELHESTIARAVASKYMDSPRGILPLRSFFTNAYTTEDGEELSSKTVKDLLRKLVDAEDKRRPLSDEALSKLIKEQGIDCARRTVAKYRGLLNIGTASQRKAYC